MGKEFGWGKLAAGVLVLALLVVAVFAFGQGQPGTGYVTASQQKELEQVTAIMPFSPAAEWLPFYAAINEGYYEQEGLNVTIVYTFEGAFGAVKQVAAGKAQFGLAGADPVIIARSQGIPVMSVYQIEHESQWGILTKKSSGLEKPADLAGKTIAIPGPGCTADIIPRTILANAGVQNVTFISVGAQLLPSFLEGKVDAMPSYLLFEELLKAKGVEFNVIRATDYGANFVAGNIITSDDIAFNNPELAGKFVRATAKGLDYAIKNPDKAVDEYIRNFNPEGAELAGVEKSFWKREVAESINPDKYALGWIDTERWQWMQDKMYEDGFVTTKTDLTKAYTSKYIG